MNESIRIATYNIHSGVGTDAVYNLDRIITVIGEINPDILAVQEVSTDPAICNDSDPVTRLRRRFGPYIAAAASLIGSRGNHYGNLLISRFPIIKSSTADLSSHSREPRNVIDSEIMLNTGTIRVITTHLGLKYAERREQVKKLVKLLENDTGKHTVLMGDINEWHRRSFVLKMISQYMKSPNAPTTYSSGFPMFSLDRIWARPSEIFCSKISAHHSLASRKASDHLPVYADIRI